VHDQPSGRRAPLPGGPHGPEDHAPHSQLEVRVGVDDHRVVPAELQQAAAQPLCDFLAHDPPHAARARRADQRQAPVGDHRLADGLVAADHEAEHAGIAHERRDAVGDAVGRHRRQGREQAGLPQNAVAADGREHRVPRPDGVREVERGDHAHGTKRQPLLEHPVPGPLAGEDLAGELTREADGKVGDVDALLHLAQALGEDLARLEADESAQRLLEPAHLLADGPHHQPAGGGGNLAPAPERLDAPRDRALAVLGGVEEDTRDGLARRGVLRDDHPRSAAGQARARVNHESRIGGKIQGAEDVDGHGERW
jgi:hypothetical protein